VADYDPTRAAAGEVVTRRHVDPDDQRVWIHADPQDDPDFGWLLVDGRDPVEGRGWVGHDAIPTDVARLVPGEPPPGAAAWAFHAGQLLSMLLAAGVDPADIPAPPSTPDADTDTRTTVQIMANAGRLMQKLADIEHRLAERENRLAEREHRG
jgi:hypothetical protein